ncbi:MAG: protease, partial [Spirochaetales bacterium]
MKQAYILVEDIYEDMEFWYPYYRLQEAGFNVTVVAPEKGKTYTSKHGYPAVSEIAAAKANPKTPAVLIVPGGYA